MTRGLRRSLALLLLLALLVTVAIASPVGTPTVGRTATHRVGISYGNTLWNVSEDKLTRAFDDAVDLGVNWVRVDLPWPDVQPDSADQYVWEPFDRLLSQAHRRSLNILPILAYTPSWARAADCSSPKCPPVDPAQFAAFTKAAAERYGPKGIHFWEIWNEPNSVGFWAPAADGQAYTRLLKAASESIRGVDPEAFILLGGLATLATASGNLSVADFLLSPGDSPLRYVDALAIHPYTFPALPSSIGPWASPRLPDDSGLPYVQDVLTKAGVPRMPIWITEYGAPSGGPGVPWAAAADPADSDHVTEPLQALIAMDAVTTASSEDAVAGLFWYTARDLPVTDEDDTENHYGLRRADGAKKPAYDAFSEAVNRLGLRR